MSEISYFSKEGLEKLKAEVVSLKTHGRADMARQIQEARDKGDLSENAEYDAAKDAQGHLEHRIVKLENILANARVVDDSKINTSIVQTLSTVKVRIASNNKEVTYQLVSEKEANVKEGKISVASPIGKGLLGKKVGEIAEIAVPSGIQKLEILEITFVI